MKDIIKFQSKIKLVITALFAIGIFVTPSVSAEASIDKDSIISLTNVERASLGLSPLVENSVLSAAASLKAKDMAAKGYFSHNTPEGKTPWSFMSAVGYTYSSAGENLAVDFVDNEAIMRAWMNSPGHRANIANGSYQEIGVAYERGIYQGRSTIFVVQMFGVPAANKAAYRAPAPVPVSTVTADPVNVSIPTVVNDARSVVEVSPQVLSNNEVSSEKVARSFESKPSETRAPITSGKESKQLTTNEVHIKKETDGYKEQIAPVVVDAVNTVETGTFLPKENIKRRTILYRLEFYLSKFSFWWRGVVATLN